MTNTFHLSLDVPHLESAVAFYRKLFGLEPTKEKPGYAKFELTDPPVALALQQSSRPRVSHLGIRVQSSDEVQASSTRLAASGLITLDERDTKCCYAVQDKVWVNDPAGNRWEIYTVLGDIEEEDEERVDGITAGDCPCC
jgi:catechol 2,3-dioxygenase-like lactoylglutathione lyase family enzyme